MRSTFKVLFYLKRNKDKDQKVVPVMGRITVNGSIAQFSAKLSVPETLWEVSGGRAKGRSLEADRINRHLDSWKAKNSCSFVSTPNPYPIMSRVTSEEASELLSENKALRRRLEEALLRLEGYEIMGDILQEEYGIDLLKKSAAGQSSVSKKDTQQ